MQVADVLHSMGIDSIDRSTVYTLDHAMLAEAETAKKNNPDYAIDIQNGQIKFKDSWTENDDCYFSLWNVVCIISQLSPTTLSGRNRGQSCLVIACLLSCPKMGYSSCR